LVSFPFEVKVFSAQRVKQPKRFLFFKDLNFMRLQVKQFDVGVEWLGRDRQRALKEFGQQQHTHGHENEHDASPSQMQQQQQQQHTHGHENEHDVPPSQMQQQQQQQEEEVKNRGCDGDTSCCMGATRLAALKAATGGGSMSPEVLRLLMPFILVRGLWFLGKYENGLKEKEKHKPCDC
jgi:hypothetical protein